jgi:hypothetical protein
LPGKRWRWLTLRSFPYRFMIRGKASRADRRRLQRRQSMA